MGVNPLAQNVGPSPSPLAELSDHVDRVLIY
jgi:hypothetical protein